MVENFNHTKAIQAKLKHIVVTNEVYEQLRNQGKVGDSFNDVVRRLLGINTITTTIGKLQDKGDKQ